MPNSFEDATRHDVHDAVLEAYADVRGARTGLRESKDGAGLPAAFVEPTSEGSTVRVRFADGEPTVFHRHNSVR